jgi:phosphotransferase system  glucose/maltose/N-acetylglucosamine-specific IIC component
MSTEPPALPRGAVSVSQDYTDSARSLMLPIAALSALRLLLLRRAQKDWLGQFTALRDTANVISAASSAPFNALTLILAMGRAVGFARSPAARPP